MKFFIEHPTKGILMQGPWQSGQWVWSWSKSRPEALMFDSNDAVRAVHELLPANVRSESYIMRYEDTGQRWPRVSRV